MGIMSDYYAAKDAEYDRQVGDGKSVMALYLESKDRESEIDDRSHMQVYLDSKDAE